MTSQHPLASHFLDQLIQSQHELVRGWVPPPMMREEFSFLINDHLSSCNDIQNAARLRAWNPIHGSVEHDYLQKIVQLTPSCSILIGPRFRGGDRSLPFVDLIASTAPLDTPELLERAIQTSLDTYSIFQPLAVRLFTAPGTLPQLPSTLQLIPDQVLIAAPAYSILNTPPPTLPPNTVLDIAPNPHETFTLAQVWYEDFHANNPHLKDLVFPAAPGDLIESESHGLLGLVHIDDQPAAVFSSKLDSDHGFHGLWILEEILAPKFIGQKLAAPLQRLYLEQIARSQPDELIIGTIDTNNIPSIKTAQRVGRHIIQHWDFIAPASDKTHPFDVAPS